MQRTWAIIERELRRFRRSPMLIVMSLVTVAIVQSGLVPLQAPPQLPNAIPLVMPERNCVLEDAWKSWFVRPWITLKTQVVVTVPLVAGVPWVALHDCPFQVTPPLKP